MRFGKMFLGLGAFLTLSVFTLGTTVAYVPGDFWKKLEESSSAQSDDEGVFSALFSFNAIGTGDEKISFSGWMRGSAKNKNIEEKAKIRFSVVDGDQSARGRFVFQARKVDNVRYVRFDSAQVKMTEHGETQDFSPIIKEVIPFHKWEKMGKRDDNPVGELQMMLESDSFVAQLADELNMTEEKFLTLAKSFVKIRKIRQGEHHILFRVALNKRTILPFLYQQKADDEIIEFVEKSRITFQFRFNTKIRDFDKMSVRINGHNIADMKTFRAQMVFLAKMKKVKDIVAPL